jgi:hypothetical protein
MSLQFSNPMLNGGGTGGVGGEGGPMMQQQQQAHHGNIPNRPPGTEYTLQGEYRTTPASQQSPS